MTHVGLNRPLFISGLLLAAGASRRMGGRNKLLVEMAGQPMVLSAARMLLRSGLDEVVVVTGFQAGAVARALSGLPLRIVNNPAYGEGMASSLRAGINALDESADAVIVALADMPFVPARVCRELVAAFDPANGADVCVPVHEGRRGNPVLWGKRYFPALAGLRGDAGGRILLKRLGDCVVRVPMLTATILRDVDMPGDISSARDNASPR